MLEIKDLRVGIEAKEIIRGLSLSVKAGEVHAIMGPNGAGKTSLAHAIGGHPSFKTKGSVRIAGQEILGDAPDERAKKGLFIAFQAPAEVEGLKITNFMRKALAARQDRSFDLDEMVRINNALVADAEKLGMEGNAVKRELNVGFSGGEKKRLEVLQMITLKPKVSILDEIDSGLDIDGIKLISKAISQINDGRRAFVIITHYPRILKYIKPSHVHVLVNGRIVKSGGEELAHMIEENGYSSFFEG